VVYSSKKEKILEKNFILQEDIDVNHLWLLEEGHCLREHSLRACKSNEIASNGGIEATSLLTLIQMIESGMGIALIPEIAIQAGLLQQTKLVAKRLTNPSPKRTIAMVARTSSTRLTELGHFIEIIQTVYRSQPT
jgi:LysR family hydrogen peroxide-inducible transcriptional activator